MSRQSCFCVCLYCVCVLFVGLLCCVSLVLTKNKTKNENNTNTTTTTTTASEIVLRLTVFDHLSPNGNGITTLLTSTVHGYAMVCYGPPNSHSPSERSKEGAFRHREGPTHHSTKHRNSGVANAGRPGFCGATYKYKYKWCKEKGTRARGPKPKTSVQPHWNPLP